MAQTKWTRIDGVFGMAARVAASIALIVGTFVLVPSAALAQSGGTDASRVQTLIEDFSHYVYIAQNDLAEANARAILDLGLDPEEFLAVVEDDPRLVQRFQDSYRTAMKRAGLADLASDLRELYEDGRRARARDVDEIKRNIELLKGGQRAKRLAMARLLEAGEYAVPELLRTLIENRDASQVLEVKRVLRALNKQAVAPLSASLLKVRPAAQEDVARILGGIGYESAIPFLVELRESTSVEAVRASADRAIERIGSDLAGRPLSVLYRELAEDYYDHSQSLTPFMGEAFQPVWTYDPSIGLVPTAVRTEVFHEAMAMRHASRSMALDRSDRTALAIWVASNYSREADTPVGYENPLYPTGERDASFYAVASGNAVLQRVLARAIEDRDTRLARQSIEALDASAGGIAVWADGGAGRPLVRALDYPDRQVRYDAALVLAGFTPEEFFEGADRVVPILAGAIRDGSVRYAAVISHEEERQQFLRQTLESSGYSALAPGRSVAEIMDSVVTVPGVDVVLIDTTESRTEEVIDEMRRAARLAATPAVALLPASATERLKNRFYGDPLVRFSRDGVSSEEIMRNADDLILETTGEALDGSEAIDYATRSVLALRDIAIASGDVYRIEDATLQLVSALENQQGGLVAAIADVLARVGERRAQVAILDRAIASRGADRVRMLRASASSAKRFGNMLEPRQTRWLAERLRDATGDEATAAAGLVGALGIASDAVVDLILER